MTKKQVVLCVASLSAAVALLTAILFYEGVLWFNMPSRQAYPVWGVDVSNWQGDIDWPVMAREGMDFVFIKATEGQAFTDARFAENWQGSREAGLLTGAYHFLSGSSTGAKQAAHFIATVPREAGMLPPVIDIEVGIAMPGINSILDEMIAALEAHYGVPPILYVTHDTFEAFVAGRYTQCPIWIRDVVKQPALSDGRDWLLWQYSNRGRLDGYEGSERFIDLNVFCGGLEAFEGMLVVATEP